MQHACVHAQDTEPPVAPSTLHWCERMGCVTVTVNVKRLWVSIGRKSSLYKNKTSHQNIVCLQQIGKELQQLHGIVSEVNHSHLLTAAVWSYSRCECFVIRRSQHILFSHFPGQPVWFNLVILWTSWRQACVTVRPLMQRQQLILKRKPSSTALYTRNTKNVYTSADLSSCVDFMIRWGIIKVSIFRLQTLVMWVSDGHHTQMFLFRPQHPSSLLELNKFIG